MKIYTVKHSDSLYGIAKHYSTSVKRLASDNALSHADRLSIGQSVVITEPVESYTVKANDTIYQIAKFYGVSVGSIYRNNPFLCGNARIKKGDELIISLPPKQFERTVTVTGYAYPYIDNTTLCSTLPYLTYLSIFTYGIKKDGTLTETDDRELIRKARSYGTAPIMMLTAMNENGYFSNELASLILSDTGLMETMADSIEKAVREKGYEGVEFDFEYIRKEDAQSYAKLISMTRERLAPQGYLVFADLAPKESGDKKGLLYEGHDYSTISDAADRILLMTYEYGYTYGPPRAIAPIKPVKKVLDYATGVIPPSKILLGEPNYGYNWTLPYIKGESKAKSLSNTEAVKLAWEKNAAISFDENSKSPYFVYYEKHIPGSTKHEVWFEDARSIYSSLCLIDEYGLAGAGVWNIMRFLPQFWLVLNSLYNIKKYDEN